jgi:cysteine sulfinate desulfinase/cysteine desulfurase-like protein
MGYGESRAREAVRVSLGWDTTDADVERFLEALSVVAEQVRQGLDARRAP